ncbi:MAG: hypothetical protein U5K00_22190 [Melioribacteraceae bacterium]|nr:hypothetical protein [Melioribacteraceae bacterium]
MSDWSFTNSAMSFFESTLIPSTTILFSSNFAYSSLYAAVLDPCSPEFPLLDKSKLQQGIHLRNLNGYIRSQDDLVK